MSLPDVLVVGGGPAGSTTAILLARRGWSVTLLDRARFPRPKACGECINPGGVAALRRLDLLDAVHALDPVPLVGWDVCTPGGRTARGRFGPTVGPGLAVERSRLDAALLARARLEGAAIEEGRRVTKVRPAEGERNATVEVAGRGETVDRMGARIVVGADGLRSVTARALVSHRPPPRHRKLSLTLRLRGSGPPGDRGRLTLSSGCTVGLAPVGPDRWNATVVVDSRERGREVAAGPEAFALERVRELVPDWNEPPTVLDGPWGSGGFDVRTKRVVGPGVVLVGDAAGYYDPLTGQGIYRALRSAELAADAIDTALRQDRESGAALVAYGRRLSREFRPGRTIQRLIEMVVSRDLPREIAVGRLGAAPRAMDAFVRVTGDARPVRSLLRAEVWADLLP